MCDLPHTHRQVAILWTHSCAPTRSGGSARKTDKSDNIQPIYMCSRNSLSWILGVSYGVSHSGERISQQCVIRAESVSFVSYPLDLRKHGNTGSVAAGGLSGSALSRTGQVTGTGSIASSTPQKGRDLRIHPWRLMRVSGGESGCPETVRFVSFCRR